MRRTPSAAALREEIEAVMARHGLHSSPAEVARFFLTTLGDRLAEFGPISPATGSFPAVAAASGPTRTALPPGSGEMVAPTDTPMGPPVASPAPPVAVVPLPSAPPPPTPIAPPATTAVAPPARPVAPAASRSLPLRWVVVGVVGLALLIGAGVGVVRKLSGGGVEVLNREPGEQLYVAGLRVDDSRMLDPKGVRQRIISTSVEGRLRRFGLAVRDDVLDVRTLTETRPVPGSQGTLHVNEPTGCLVEVDGRMAPGTTPVTLPIEAGRELEVRVSCPQQLTWSRRVMAVPGQDVVAVALAREPVTP